jgi:Carboxypeptidase regulatory-like domain/TonB dependent receptor-like, beta-barrel
MDCRKLRPSILLWIIAAAGICFSQALTGEIKGGVADTETKLALPAVAVRLLSVDRGWQKPAETDAEGNYVFIQLEPGNYTLAFEKEGYYSNTKTDILVRLNQTRIVLPPVELRRLVSTATQQITVATPEGSKVAVIDLTAPVPAQSVLTYVTERGYTALTSLTDSSLRWNFDNSVLGTVPLRGGRTFDQLALMAPGVVRVPFTGGEGPAVGAGVGTAGQFAVNGLRGRSNNFTVDGSDNNDEDIGVRRQGFVALTPQSAESVQDFQIMTAGFPADFGRNVGSMANAVSRSGETQHHGTLYGLFNSTAFNARRFFDLPFSDRVNSGVNSGGSFTDRNQNFQQIGGITGGPLVVRRLYYFSSIQHEHSHGTSLRHFVVPTAAERGLRVSKDDGGFVPVGELEQFMDERNTAYSSLAGQGVLGLYPLPNNPDGPFSAHTYSAARRAETRSNGFSLKGDWYAAERHSFTARYNFTDDRSILPFTSDAMQSSLANRTRTQNLSLFHNFTKPHFGSALRVSYGRTHLAFPQEGSSPFLFGSPLVPALRSAAQPIQTPYGRFGPFGATGPIGQLSVLPYDPIGIDVFNFPQGRSDNTYQLADALTWTRLRHTIRVGADFRRTQLNSFADRNSRPLLIFGYGEVSSDCIQTFGCSFATSDGLLHGTDLATLGAPSGFLQAISTQSTPDSSIGLRMGQIDFFAQDDWKIHPRLVLNLGIRYELQSVTKETNRRIESTFEISPGQFPQMQPIGPFAPTIRGGNAAFNAAVDALRKFLGGRSTIYDPDYNNIAPRIGLAWDATGDGRMSIRAGFGLAYDANLGAVTSQSRNVFPTFVPVNLDLNFLRQAPGSVPGLFLNSPTFFKFDPTNTPLIRPGTLNDYNLTGDAFATGLGVLLSQAPGLPGQPTNGLAFTLPEKKLQTSYAENWTLSIERSLNVDTLATLSYVGTHGVRLPRFATPNAGRISTPLLLASAVQPLTLRSFPPSTDPLSNSRPLAGLGGFSVFEDSAASGYHALQLSVERRLRQGLQFRGSWTWGHVIDEVSDPFDARAFTALPQNSTRPDLERGSANFDVRHRVVSYAVWDIPAISTHRAFRDWRIAATAEFQTGQPFTVNTAVDRNLDGNLTDRLNRTDGITVVPHDAWPLRIQEGVNPLDLIAPKRQNGAVGRNTFRADGIATVDLALSRDIRLRESAALNLRAEAFNVFNRTHFGVPVRILESPAFGRTYDLTVEPRTIRFYAKVSF